MSSESSPTLRKKILALRRAQSRPERTSKTAQVFERWRNEVAAASFREKKVGLYRAFDDELSLSLVEEFLQKEGAFLYYPRFTPRSSVEFEMVCSSSAAPFQKGIYKFEEPVSGEILEQVAELDVIFVPGVVFGPGGERLGFGAGHYDRFLAKNSTALRVSLAFDFQCCENIIQNHWDQAVDWVLTECRDFRGPKWIERFERLSKPNQN